MEATISFKIKSFLLFLENLVRSVLAYPLLIRTAPRILEGTTEALDFLINPARGWWIQLASGVAIDVDRLCIPAASLDPTLQK